MIKYLLSILLFISLSAQSQVVNFMQDVTPPAGIPQTVASTVIDDGYYNGFPFPAIMSNGDIICLYKKAGGHAPKGPLTLARTTNGGTSWSEQQITVDGDSIECAALSLVVLSSDRILIAYQDDDFYTQVKFAYRDGFGYDFTFSDSLDFGSGYIGSISPVKMVVMPSGKIRFPYYSLDTSDIPTQIGFFNSTDNGQNWVDDGEVIFSHSGTGYGDYTGNEFSVLITDNTGVDSTCKMAVYVRTGGISFYQQHKSTDGGVTWSTSFVEDAAPGGPYSRHLFYNMGPVNGAPSDMIIHNDSVYFITGLRNTNPSTLAYQLQYMVTTKENAFTNNYTVWATGPIDTVIHFNAETLGGDIDCGYPLLFHDGNGELWAMYYDISTEAKDPMITEDRCWIKLIKIAD